MMGGRARTNYFSEADHVWTIVSTTQYCNTQLSKVRPREKKPMSLHPSSMGEGKQVAGRTGTQIEKKELWEKENATKKLFNTRQEGTKNQDNSKGKENNSS